MEDNDATNYIDLRLVLSWYDIQCTWNHGFPCITSISCVSQESNMPYIYFFFYRDLVLGCAFA